MITFIIITTLLVLLLIFAFAIGGVLIDVCIGILPYALIVLLIIGIKKLIKKNKKQTEEK